MKGLKKNILAVDLGKSGGFFSNIGEEIFFTKMPKEDIPRARWICGSSAQLIVAENVHMWAGSSSQSGGTLMEGKGFLRGVASSLKITTEWIEPLSWIQCYTIKRTRHFLDKKGKPDKKAWKLHLMDIAKELVPSLVNDISLEITDALLIWHYIARRESGNPMKPVGAIL